MTVNIVSVCVGPKYRAHDYVLKLHDMVQRNASNLEEIRHWSLTDAPELLPEGITPIPAKPDLPGYWAKLYMFSGDMPWAEGERVAYFDLDVVITGRLEDLIERKGIMQDQFWPCFNTSCMVWDHGEHRRVWEDFLTRDGKPSQKLINGPLMIPPLVPLDMLPEGQPNGGDQEHVSICEGMGSGRWQTFPAEWCVSYTDARLWPPQDCKVVVYHGETHKPHLEPPESWIHNVWKVGGYTSLPEMKGMNVSHEQALANVAENIKLDLDWFTGAPQHGKTMVLVCGGPSMKDHIREIRDHQKRGARIITVNNALKFMMGVGIKPFAHVILDARPQNVEFLQDAPEGVRYLLASQCDPSLFAALRAAHGRHDVICWHNQLGDGSSVEEIIKDDPRPQFLIPGGCTVGLRALWLGWGSGYRKIHVYGMDSSLAGGEHHAYAQPMNDGEMTLEVAMGGEKFICTKWMARQAEDFARMYPEITAEPVGRAKEKGERALQLFVHGNGLVPAMARVLRAEREAA